jgi:hypothetical protein
MNEMRETAPVQAFLAYGWIVGNETAPKFMRWDYQTEVARTAYTAAPYSGSINTGTNIGDAIRSKNRFNGLMRGPIQTTQSLKANTAGGAADGCIIYRFFKGYNPTGGDAQLLTESYYSSSLFTNLSTTPSQLLTGSHNIPPTRFNNEFLFIQIQLAVQGSGTGTTQDANIFTGPTTQSVFRMYNFEISNACADILNHDEYPAP